MLRAALLTLQYTQDHGAIGLTKTKAFKRIFVHWAVEHFEWPGKSSEEMFRYNKVINEYEFPPLEVLHYLLITLRLGRHFKGEFRLTKRGAALAQAPGKLFSELDPSSFSRSTMPPTRDLKSARLVNGMSGFWVQRQDTPRSGECNDQTSHTPSAGLPVCLPPLADMPEDRHPALRESVWAASVAYSDPGIDTPT